MRTKTKDKADPLLPLCASVVALCVLLTHTEAAKKGMTDALTLCGTVMIPSLFPMLILSRFAAACRCPAKLQAVCAGPLRALFGLSPGCLTPLLLGLAGGYPLAAKAAGAARTEGWITEEDARRLTLFFTCPGIPFAVIVAGGCFRSRAVGWTLLTACITADGFAAFCYRLLSRKRTLPEPSRQPCGSPSALSDRLIRSVDEAAKAMLSICAWIGAFSAFIGVFNAATGDRWNAAVSLFAEVTAALKTAAGNGDVPLTAACLAFGGVCVCCQLLPDLKTCGAGAVRFLAVRLVCAATAYAVQTALLRLLCIPIPTETQIGGFYLTADSAAGSAALLFLCAVFMAETTRKRA